MRHRTGRVSTDDYTLHSSAPSDALKPFVRAFAQRSGTWPGTGVSQAAPASLESVIDFEFGDCPTVDYRDGNSERVHAFGIVGPHSHYRADLRFHGKVETFGVFLQPLAMGLLFSVPNRELTDSVYPASDVFDRAGRRLWLMMAEKPSFADRVAIVERYLLDLATRARRPPATIAVAEYIVKRRGVVRVADLADQTSLSIRHFERRFSQDVGLSPKLFARIARFQAALDTKINEPRAQWLQIAHGLGYYDQMHLIRDFRDLGGNVPTRLISSIGDARPSALAASLKPLSGA
jgi:AraC-like DNA-binding protein